MALTPEQQAQLDFQIEQQKLVEAADAARRQHDKDMENLRHQNNLAAAQANLVAVQTQADAQALATSKQVKLETVRLAKDTLVENRRIKPAASATDITAADIIAFAATLETHVNS
jgi:hypothetical protein